MGSVCIFFAASSVDELKSLSLFFYCVVVGGGGVN